MTALAVINGIAIVVLVLVTAYYAWQTHEMAGEMRRARLLSLLPRLVLDVEMIGPTYGVIVVRNVGTGPALEADLTIVFASSESGDAERRRWRPHVIAPGERHEFLPPTDIGDMTGLVARHPSVSLEGRIQDALGQHHDVEERIDLAAWWDRLGEAVHRWQEDPANRLVREVEKTRKELEGIRRQLPRLAPANKREPNA